LHVHGGIFRPELPLRAHRCSSPLRTVVLTVIVTNV
jgi:hypothetical protein